MFEGFDRAGSLRAICGGGRYDRLLGTFGGEDQPCAGFGFGDAVIVELLKDKGLLPEVGGWVGGCGWFLCVCAGCCGARASGRRPLCVRTWQGPRTACLPTPVRTPAHLPARSRAQLRHEVDDLVVALDEGLRPRACEVAAALRRAGRRVDLVLEGKRLKWAFKQAERCNAGGCVGGWGCASALAAVGARAPCWQPATPRPNCHPIPAARLVLLAPEELERGNVKVKELATREEREVPLEQLLAGGA